MPNKSEPREERDEHRLPRAIEAADLEDAAADGDGARPLHDRGTRDARPRLLEEERARLRLGEIQLGRLHLAEPAEPAASAIGAHARILLPTGSASQVTT